MLGKNPATAYAQGMKSGYRTVRNGEQSTSTHWSSALQLNMGSLGSLRVSTFMAEMKAQGFWQKKKPPFRFHHIINMWHCL